MAEERSFRQMQETSQSGQSGQLEQYVDLDERLASYYGSALPEQPLPASSWQQVRSQLGSRPRSKRRPTRSVLPGFARLRRTHSAMPSYISSAFFRIAYDARIPITRASLDCRFKVRVQLPAVHVSPLGKISLTLPLSTRFSMEPQLLDVLLATGMARLLYARKLPYRLVNLFMVGLALLVSIACLLLWMQERIPLADFLIAIGIWIVVGILLHVRGRRLALRADDLMVQWLGRTRACQGLHMLADRSRKTYRVRWRELSLAERIARVCGTRVEAEDEQLTLVR